MATEYSKFEHTHVLVKHPTAPRREGWDGPMAILLHTGPRVWVPASYAHERTADIVQVGDTFGPGYDEDGNCVLSIPAEWCTFHTPEEAEAIEQAMDADDQLLSYAT